MSSTEVAALAIQVAQLEEKGYWFCGGCGSVIPVTYWHTCGGGKTHTAPVSPR